MSDHAEFYDDRFEDERFEDVRFEDDRSGDDRFDDRPHGARPAPPRRSGGGGVAMLLVGMLVGGLGASVVWGAALVGVILAYEEGGFDEDFFAEEFSDAAELAALTAALNANPTVDGAVGRVTGLTLNEDRSYDMDAELDEWFYDVTASDGTALLRARFHGPTDVYEADLTLPDGTVLPLDLVVPDPAAALAAEEEAAAEGLEEELMKGEAELIEGGVIGEGAAEGGSGGGDGAADGGGA